MAQIGPTARAIAVVDTTVTDDELKRLAGLGVRGIRFNLVQAGATTIDMVEPLSKRVKVIDKVNVAGFSTTLPNTPCQPISRQNFSKVSYMVTSRGRYSRRDNNFTFRELFYNLVNNTI